MSYLRNNTVNLLNLHYGISMLALNGGGVFYAVFLLRAGVPVPLVFGTLAVIVAARFVMRPCVFFIARNWGLKPTVVLGTIVCGFQYPLLAEVHGLSGVLLVLCLVSAIGDTLYWTTYHAYFASLGDAEHRGHQIGAREALSSIAGIFGPALGGWALMVAGPRVAFGATACVQLLAAVPFFGTPNVHVIGEARHAFRAAHRSTLLFATDGWIAATYVFAWQIALFISLGESFSSFGGAMALAALIGAVAGLLLGRHIDSGHGARSTVLALITLALTALLRATSVGIPVLAVIANACGALVSCLYTPALMTAVYNQSKRSPCPLRFHIATEAGWDIGCAFGCLTVAFMAAMKIPLSAGILLSLCGILPVFKLLRQHYSEEDIPGRPIGVMTGSVVKFETIGNAE